MPFLIIALALGGIVYFTRNVNAGATGGGPAQLPPSGGWPVGPGTPLPGSEKSAALLGDWQILNCYMTYTNGQREPCVPPVVIDKAIQRAADKLPVHVLFRIGRSAIGGKLGSGDGGGGYGTVDESYTVWGRLIAATIKDGIRYSGVAALDDFKSFDGRQIITKSQIVTLTDWSFENIDMNPTNAVV